jgi:hypothetical protein
MVDEKQGAMKPHILNFWLFAILTFSSVAQAGIDLVKLRDSTDEEPAFGAVDFSYLRKDSRKETDQHGNIKLPPPPHDKPDPVEVCPKEKAKYGGCFRQQFPKDDGIIWLLTLSGAKQVEQKGEEFAQLEQFKPAAALTAIVSDFYKESNPERAQSLMHKALSFLAHAYDKTSPKAGLPDEDLRRAVFNDDSVPEKPAREGAWDSLDFLYIAGATRSQALQLAGLANDK